MKDGGTSVDTYFNCLRQVYNFRILQQEGPNVRAWGEESCPIGFCQSHHPLAAKVEVCGPAFADSAGFTVLREPLSRAFSLFNFYKYNQKLDILLDDDVSFLELLNRTYKCRNNQIGKPGKEPFCAAWNNELTSFYLAPNPVTFLLAYGQRGDSMLQIGHTATDDDLESAKRLLKGLDAVFLTENLGNWVSLFGKSGLPFSDKAAQCELPHVLEADCDGPCPQTPSEEEAKLFAEMNHLDIELYNYAKTLPQHYS